MLILNSIKNSFLFLIAILPLYLPATEKILLEVNSVSESINEQYTLENLLTLPQHKMRTKLPWTKQVNTYEGPYLKDVLDSVGAKGQWLTLKASDNYSVTFNFQNVEKFNPILALSVDGKLLTTRTKGPIWLLLPVDEYSELNAAIYNDYMVWHLRFIRVENKE